MNDDQRYSRLSIEPDIRSKRVEPVMSLDFEEPELLIEQEYQEPDIPGVPKTVRPWVKPVLFLAAMILPLVSIYAVDQRLIQDRFLFTQIAIKDGFDSRGAGQIRETALSELDGNFFSANLGKVKDRVAQAPWISSVSVHRQWPSTLVIAVDPINPVARWNDRKWINYTGEVLDIPPFIEAHEIAHLPVLSGAPDEESKIFEFYLDWSERFAAWGLTLVSLTADDVQEWHLELSPSVLSRARTPSESSPEPSGELKTPTRMVVNQQNAVERISRFVASLDRGLIDQFERIESIDLRYTNGFAIRWKEEEGETVAMRESG
ncbi:MAG: FtsQ-type POTRA domain-containing protein [Gammaproteobacteria bacterium]|nr:FtsQ-type POTRA domain-containing protein [Gammaproteobacteria bacterium]MCY4228228.1 FtsQ-type POTRA domain-containing protein [Gammaproteobacteria bacterium]